MDSGYVDSALGAVVLLITFIVVFIFAAAGYIITSIFLMKIFDKAGVQGRWRAWVPIYNAMIFLKLGDLNPWLLLIGAGASAVLAWVPVIGPLIGAASLVLMAVAAWRVGLKLQKDAVWVILYVFLSIVWLGIAAFDRSRWNPQIVPAPWASNGFLADRTVWDGVPVQVAAASPAPGYGAPQGYGAPTGPGGAPAYGAPPAYGA
ncbi:MAG: DUF5684 domain-containing protein, partial [Microbacterium sp.]